MALHRTRLLTDGGLCDAIQLGGLREALGLDKIGEDFEVLHLHGKRFFRGVLSSALIGAQSFK
jgi:hypothetical protein